MSRPLETPRASAPGSIGNFGPGLDILGCAVTGLRDIVEAKFTDRPGVHVDDTGHKDLPIDPTLHASAIAAHQVLTRCATDQGVSLRLTKQLPLAGGQGGSAASAVAGALATNALLGGPLSTDDLLLAALHAESRVAGRHLDNVAPALLGKAIDDRIAEPARAVLLPGFLDAKRAALETGSLGCSISGAGPTAFALTGDDATAQRVVDAMCAAYAECGIPASGRVAHVDQSGATIESQ